MASFRKYVNIFANSLGPSGDTRVLPLASVKHTRPNLKAKCDWVVGALFRYSDFIKIDENRGLEGPKIV